MSYVNPGIWAMVEFVSEQISRHNTSFPGPGYAQVRQDFYNENFNHIRNAFPADFHQFPQLEGIIHHSIRGHVATREAGSAFNVPPPAAAAAAQSPYSGYSGVPVRPFVPTLPPPLLPGQSNLPQPVPGLPPLNQAPGAIFGHSHVSHQYQAVVPANNYTATSYGSYPFGPSAYPYATPAAPPHGVPASYAITAPLPAPPAQAPVHIAPAQAPTAPLAQVPVPFAPAQASTAPPAQVPAPFAQSQVPIAPPAQAPMPIAPAQAPTAPAQLPVPAVPSPVLAQAPVHAPPPQVPAANPHPPADAVPPAQVPAPGVVATITNQDAVSVSNHPAPVDYVGGPQEDDVSQITAVTAARGLSRVYRDEIEQFRGSAAGMQKAIEQFHEKWFCGRGGIVTVSGSHLRRNKIVVSINNVDVVVECMNKRCVCTCTAGSQETARSSSNSTGRLGLMKLYIANAVNPDGTQDYYFCSPTGTKDEVLGHFKPRSSAQDVFSTGHLLSYIDGMLSPLLAEFPPSRHSRYVVYTKFIHHLRGKVLLDKEARYLCDASQTVMDGPSLQQYVFEKYQERENEISLTVGVLQGEAQEYAGPPPIGTVHHTHVHTSMNSIYNGRPQPQQLPNFDDLDLVDIDSFCGHFSFKDKDECLFIPIPQDVFNGITCFTPADQRTGKSCYVFCSPTQLFALYRILKSGSMCHLLAWFMDAKFKFYRVGSNQTCLIDLATVHVGLHGHPDTVSRSNLSLVHCIAPGEQKVAVFVMTRVYVDAVHNLLGYKLQFEVLCADRSPSIENGIKLLPEAAMCYQAKCAEHTRVLPLKSWRSKILKASNAKTIMRLVGQLYFARSHVNVKNACYVLASVARHRLNEPIFANWLAMMISEDKFNTNFYYSCMGIIGITPLTQSLERWWEALSGNPKIGILPGAFSNVGMKKVLDRVCPSILKMDSFVIDRLPVGIPETTLCFPHRCLSFHVVVWASLLEDKDIYQMPNEEWLVSRPQRFGLGCGREDLARYTAEMSQPFQQGLWSNLDISLTRYIDYTNGFCHLRKIGNQLPEVQEKLAHLTAQGCYYYCVCPAFYEQYVCSTSAYFENKRHNVSPCLEDLVKRQ